MSNTQQVTLNMLNENLKQNYHNLIEAEAAFIDKYSKDTYKIIDPEGGACYQHHKTILEKYGNNLMAISIEGVDLIDEVIDSDDDSNWLIQSLTRNCTGLKKLELTHLAVDLKKILSALPNLNSCSLVYLAFNDDDWHECQLRDIKHLKIKGDIRLKPDPIEKFIENNRQIETLDMSTYFNPFKIIGDKLTTLKQLTIQVWSKISIEQDMVKLDSLESLDIDLIMHTDLAPVLAMIRGGCNNIKNLNITLPPKLFREVEVKEDALIAAICSFEKLTSIKVNDVSFSEQQIQQFSCLKQLTSLNVEMEIDDELANEILRVIPKFVALTQFLIRLNGKLFGGFNYDFHQQLLVATAKHQEHFKLILSFLGNDDLEERIFTKDNILHSAGSTTVLVHSVGYEAAFSESKFNILDLKDNSLLRLFDHLDLVSLIALKQTCKTMQSKVNEYVEVAYQTREFVCNANENIGDLRKVLNLFGRFFHMIKIEIPSLCEQTEIFGMINRFCKNATEIHLVNRSFTNNLINPVQFSLPNLQRLVYHNNNDIDLEIGAFALGFPMLNCLDLKSTGHLDNSLHILNRNDSFVNLAVIKMNCTLVTIINMLDNLSDCVAKQLRELSITTPSYYIEESDKRLADVINRFQNLKSLELKVPGDYLDSQTLFNNRQSITELSILIEDEDETSTTTLNHIQSGCTNLRSLDIYYTGSVPANVLKNALELFPNTAIKSVQIDPYGEKALQHPVNTEWLHQLSKSY